MKLEGKRGKTAGEDGRAEGGKLEKREKKKKGTAGEGKTRRQAGEPLALRSRHVRLRRPPRPLSMPHQSAEELGDEGC